MQLQVLKVQIFCVNNVYIHATMNFFIKFKYYSSRYGRINRTIPYNYAFVTVHTHFCTRTHSHTHINVNIYMYICTIMFMYLYIYIYVYKFVYK